MPDPVDVAIVTELAAEGCEAAPCTSEAHWIIERAPGEYRRLCDRHYALWPVTGGMFTRTRLATEWGWPRPEPTEDDGE